ncbi:MAG TPA: hypothetical protein VEY70_15350 [Metabacillus sp.]|nr:hypothetical protein [Metabacillus sp.]
MNGFTLNLLYGIQTSLDTVPEEQDDLEMSGEEDISVEIAYLEYVDIYRQYIDMIRTPIKLGASNR